MTWATKATLGLLGAVGGVLVWQLASVVWGGSTLPGPAATAEAATTLVREKEFWSQSLTTFIMAGHGLLAASIVGAILGVLVGSSPRLSAAMQVPMEFLKPVPPIVILPIAILVLGPTQQMGVALVFYGCVLPITYTTANGVRDTDPVALQTAHSFGLSKWQVLWRVTIPSTSAYIGTAIRIAMPHAFVIAVVAGYLGGSPGLGRAIAQSLVAGDSAQLYAVVIALGFLGLLVHEVSHWAESRVLHWHSSYREVAV